MKRLILFLGIMSCGVRAEAVDFNINSTYVSASIKDSLKASAIELVAMDWHQTRTNASNNWEWIQSVGEARGEHFRFRQGTKYKYYKIRETNSVLGEAPNTGTVDAYFASCSLALIYADQVLPTWASTALYVGVTAIQFITVSGNIDKINYRGQDVDTGPPMVRLSFKF
jgi:hypothetical protein